jgi:hypothetical protein
VADGQPAGLALLVVHRTKSLFCVAAWQEKAARNDPERHSSRLCRAGVFVPVVAQPIQDMSRIRRWASVCHVCGAEQG